MPRRDDLIRELEPYLADLALLLDSDRRRFDQISERDVPEAAGLYVIYCEAPFETWYAGKAGRRSSPSAWGQPDGLRFRIMKNHLGYQGTDNFVRYVKEEFQLVSVSETRAYIRKCCSVNWSEVEDVRRLSMLEHLAIATLRPRFNRG